MAPWPACAAPGWVSTTTYGRPQLAAHFSSRAAISSGSGWRVAKSGWPGNRAQARTSTAKLALVATETGMLRQLEVVARLPEQAV